MMVGILFFHQALELTREFWWMAAILMAAAYLAFALAMETREESK